MTNIMGVVLCGGKSSRMGKDKGLIKKENITWAEVAFNKLKSLSIPAVVSINDSQLFEYQKVFPHNLLIADKLDIAGPLKGILSVHLKYPNNDLFVLACDIVDVDFQQLSELKEVYDKEKDSYDFFVYKNDNYFEPLCGIYNSQALANILDNTINKQLTGYGVNDILKKGNTFSLSIPQNLKKNFNNYNTPDF
jgi:molybdenum cofactor guanylyltransferase